MKRDSCLARVTAGAAIGGALGGAVGAVYGTYEAVRYKVPGLLKIRHIGQTTLGTAAVFGLFLGIFAYECVGENVQTNAVPVLPDKSEKVPSIEDIDLTTPM